MAIFDREQSAQDLSRPMLLIFKMPKNILSNRLLKIEEGSLFILGNIKSINDMLYMQPNIFKHVLFLTVYNIP